MDKLISIICATYNSQETLHALLESVRKQSCQDFEFILVDGKSSDNTLQILENNLDIITKSISEEDNGIYDAWNKGLRLASTQWISFVGADDILCDDYVGVYKHAIKSFSEQSVDYISSKVNYIDNAGNTLKVIGTKWCWKEFRHSMKVAHVGSLHNYKLFSEVGDFNPSYKIVGDYELLLRKGKNLKTAFVDKVTVNMRGGGRSLSFGALFERYRAHRYVAGLSLVASVFNLLFGIAKLIRFKIVHRINR